MRFVAVGVLLLVACSPTTARPAPSASEVAVSCSLDSVHTGPRPNWLEDAGAHNNPDLPYVIASPHIAAGFLFRYPLVAGHPVEPSNKILWVVGRPRNGSALKVTAHPLGVTSPVVVSSFPDNSGPGEIYPSSLDVPSPGCWLVELRWAGNVANVALGYT